MKNILHIIESLEFGGAEKVVLQLANGMSVDGNYNVGICITKREGELLKKLNDNITVFSLNSKDGNNYSTVTKIKNIIIKNNIDVVHIHNWGVFIESTIASKLSGASKVIHTVHGPYISYTRGIKATLKIYIRHMIERFLSRYIDQFISVSDSIRNYMVNDIGINKNKIKVIHNGIAGLNLKTSKLSEPKIINLVSVGRVAKIKNHQLLLNALKMIESKINFHLTIVGDGPELNNIKEQCNKLLLNENISFLGFRTDIDEILTNMDICVVTSDYEGISIAILEAMSIGMPVIASSVGGNPETVADGKSGILFPKDDESALVEALIKLSKSATLRELMGESGYQRFIKHFHQDNVFKQYSLIYKNS